MVIHIDYLLLRCLINHGVDLTLQSRKRAQGAGWLDNDPRPLPRADDGAVAWRMWGVAVFIFHGGLRIRREI